MKTKLGFLMALGTAILLLAAPMAATEAEAGSWKHQGQNNGYGQRHHDGHRAGQSRHHRKRYKQARRHHNRYFKRNRHHDSHGYGFYRNRRHQQRHHHGRRHRRAIVFNFPAQTSYAAAHEPRVVRNRDIVWNDPDGGDRQDARVFDREARQDERYCREYQGVARVNGREEVTYGTACRQPDGSWEIVD